MTLHPLRAENKYNFRNEIRYENQKAKEERAKKDWNRNTIGLYLSSIVFLVVLLATFNGMNFGSNLSMLLIVASMMGVFYFGRELRVLPKGQLIFSGIKAILCLGMAIAYSIFHQGFWDAVDYTILAVLVGVVLVDLPRVMKAWKDIKG